MARNEPKYWTVEIEKVVTETVWVKSTTEEGAKKQALKEVTDSWRYDVIKPVAVTERG